MMLNYLDKVNALAKGEAVGIRDAYKADAALWLYQFNKYKTLGEFAVKYKCVLELYFSLTFVVSSHVYLIHSSLQFPSLMHTCLSEEWHLSYA